MIRTVKVRRDLYPWVRPLLGELKLVRGGEIVTDQASIRDKIERSGLPNKLEAICELVNAEAGERILHEQAYLAPHRRVCSYEFRRKGIDYVMELSV